MKAATWATRFNMDDASILTDRFRPRDAAA